MIDDLRAGDTFAAAAARIPKHFPSFYVGILESAELTGNLDTVLNQLADYIDRDVEGPSRHSLQRSSTRPSWRSMSVVRRHGPGHLRHAAFRGLLQVAQCQASAADPHAARQARFFSHLWYAILGVVIVVVVGFIGMQRSPEGKAMLDCLILKLPVLGLAGPGGRSRANVPRSVLNAQGGSRPSTSHGVTADRPTTRCTATASTKFVSR